ncbi:MAG: extracellular solute-binding protein family 5 [Thermomicrobiales bacterium]|jgi:peptide/nickel transport system substrate-binding protein|nr:extracellular solute-binding protein family 5 [Thermomicrobiales bacterium]MDF3041320.1 extracellular solute-binding protein family 5 [Thermomicrobiales bacterium]
MSQHDQRNGRDTTPIEERLLRRRVSRRTIVGSGAAGAAGLAAAGALNRVGAVPGHGDMLRASVLPLFQEATPAAEGIYGGRLRVATTGQPAGLDMQWINQRTVTLIGWNMFEALFTFDAEYNTVPMLAEGIEVSDDGLVNKITLRQGVPFHNGEEMRAADVVASFNRWAGVASLGLAISDFLDEIVEVDPYALEFRLTSPLVALPSLLARQQGGLSIHPKAIMEAAASEQLTAEQYISTGPYKFVEFQPDRFTLLDRFDDYVGVDSPPSGYAGSKAAYLDEIEFIPVPEEAARVAGLQAGEYNYLEEIIPDQIAVLQDSPGVTIEILPPRSYGIIILNTAGGLFTNQTLRQAVSAAIEVEASGQATHGEGYFELGPGIMLPQTAWNSDVSAELYNQNNPEKAAQLLQEAGYDGTAIRLLCTQEDLGDYNAAVVAQQQLEQAGFTVELEVSDEATLEENLEDDERWDMTTAANVLRPDPVLIDRFASCSLEGKWCTEEKNAVIEQLQTESDFETRYAALEELQRLFYEQVPMVKLVNNYGVAALSSNVQGLLGRMHFEIEPEFANCWLEEA